MQLVEGVNLEKTLRRVVDENGEVKEYMSKQEVRDDIARWFEERDDFNENGINSMEELVYN